MKYLKKFENHSAYQAAESGLILPNVSLCVQENEVHYKPIVPPEPIAPVGKVQVFANPECTAYADGQSNEVWVRLNQDFGFGDSMVWGNMANPKTFLGVYTPFSDLPTDPYAINLWVDFTEGINRDGSQPFSRGEIVHCSMPLQYFVPLDNPQVIFE